MNKHLINQLYNDRSEHTSFWVSGVLVAHLRSCNGKSFCFRLINKWIRLCLDRDLIETLRNGHGWLGIGNRVLFPYPCP